MSTVESSTLPLAIVLVLSTIAGAQQSGRVAADARYQSVSNSGSAACELTGVVVNAISGEAISHARLRLNFIRGANQLMVSAEGNGRFLLPDVPPGRQSVTARKKGYLDASFDIVACQPSQSSRDNAREQLSGLATLRLIPLSAIAGRVTDEAGDPVVDAEVHAKQAGTKAGQLRSLARASTDDLGMYRLHGLPPGTYYISAGPPETGSSGPESAGDETLEDYQTTYYPQGTQVSAASPVSVQPGTSATGVDIQLAKGRPQTGITVLPVSATSLPSSDNASSSPSPGPAGPANAARATMAGTIVNDLTNEPVKRAKITLEPARNGGASYGLQTDADGRFLVQNVDAGTYRAVVDRAGFLSIPHASGSASQIPASITLKPKQVLRDVVLRVIPWSVVSGRVFDQDGNPAQDFQVQALRFSYVNGKRQLQTVATSVTNDLGEYRLYGLSRGKYYISTGAQGASPDTPAGASERYVATYYPQALEVESAAPLAVGDGVQVGGINVWARVSKLLDVRGRVLGASALVNRDAVVALTRTSADAEEISFNATRGIDAQGHFDFSAVPPGSYTLSAVVNDADGQYVAEQTVQVTDSSVDNIDLQLNKAASMTGRIQVDGGATAALKSVRVLMEPENSLPTGSVVGDVHSDGTFSVSGLLPDQYIVELFGLPDNYYVKVIRSGNVETHGRRIDFSQATGSLTVVVAAGASVAGSVTNDDQQLASGIDVVLIPTSQDADGLEPYRTVASDRQGKFRFVGLAPGTYEIFAIQGVDPNAYIDPDFLASVQDYAESVTLQDTATANLNIHMVPSANQ